MLGEGEAETGVTNGFERLREEEDALLVENGFEPVGNNLWIRTAFTTVRRRLYRRLGEVKRGKGLANGEGDRAQWRAL